MTHVKSIRGAVSGSRQRTGTNFALLRRATATYITLVLLAGLPSYGAADISVVVVDRDGHGLSEAPGRRSGGLANMVTRASLIRAQFKAVGGEGGKGTRLELVLPAIPTAAPADLEVDA